MEFAMKSQQNLSNEVLSFINSFKKMYPQEIEDVFSNGYCYWFSFILTNRFNGEIIYLPIQNHFVSFINNNYYDINGIVNLKEKPYNWNEYKQFDELDYQRVIKYCIKKEE